MFRRSARPLLAALVATFMVVLASACSGDSAPPDPISLTLADGTQGLFAPADALGVGENMIDVTLKNADGTPMAGEQLVVDAFMPAHGHGLRQEPRVHDVGEGHYMIHIDFHMTGHWDMSVAMSDAADAPSFSVPLEVQ